MKKNTTDENFPVGRFIKKSLRHLVESYYQAAREADDITDNHELNIEEKQTHLNELQKDFMTAANDTAAGKLGRLFVAENLDYRLFTDLLAAFRKDVKGFSPLIWEQLLDYCRYSAAPVGRFMLAIHNQDPATYMPAEILCAVLQITNHLHDLKSDACLLRRCYIPFDLLEKFEVRITDFCLAQSTTCVKNLISDVVLRLQAMLDDAKILISLISDYRLRCEVGVIFSLTNSMLKKIQKEDVISKAPRLSGMDWLKGGFYGVWCAFAVRAKSCSRIK